ncbi:F-box domain-containing protein [Xylariomycetidae sp. FL2044]|nr:F-box domain-containing protein [Xylariomycetidae sp. FL2044]
MEEGRSDGEASDRPSTPGPSRDREQQTRTGEAVPTSPKPTPASVTVNVPNPAVTYGGINPEIDENVILVEGIPDDEFQRDVSKRRNYDMFAQPPQSLRADPLEQARGSNTKEKGKGLASAAADLPSNKTKSLEAQSGQGECAASSCESTNTLLTLPSELIDSVLAYLSPLELASASAVCRVLRVHANANVHWQGHVQSNLPNRQISSPYPCQTWRQLYASLDPHWFLTKHKIWFCDRGLTGKMVVVRYDERRGCIEGYQLLATRDRDGSEPWLANQNVHIHYFEPKVRLHLDKPILQFNANTSPAGAVRNHPQQSSPHFSSERPMHLSHGIDPRFSSFMLAKPLSSSAAAECIEKDFPYGNVWPPPSVPARHRVAGQPADLHHAPTSINYLRAHSALWKPQHRSEASNQTFRIRQWMEMGPPALGVHVGEEVVTYSTLDPYLYTPTAEKPWRGIWVGDYSGHGCEFLLINQPDGPGEKEVPLQRLGDETEEAFQSRFLDERVYRGRLEAIKLTGDANVPRGEPTFIAADLGQKGFVGIAEDPPFQGARVVKSKGHIAASGFFNDKYVPSQLILLSHNRLAQYWVGFGHISFFERVDIDQFLTPK